MDAIVRLKRPTQTALAVELRDNLAAMLGAIVQSKRATAAAVALSRIWLRG